MADRYVVTMKSGDTTITYDGKATDAIAAVLACVKMGGARKDRAALVAARLAVPDFCLPACNHAPAGIYEVEVGIYGRKPSAGRVGVRADGSLTIGARPVGRPRKNKGVTR